MHSSSSSYLPQPSPSLLEGFVLAPRREHVGHAGERELVKDGFGGGRRGQVVEQRRDDEAAQTVQKHQAVAAGV